MVSADRTSRRRLHATGTGRRLSCVLEWGSCHTLLICPHVHLPNGQSEANPHGRPTAPPPPSASSWSSGHSHSWCCLGPIKRCGVGTVGHVSDLSRTRWKADGPPRTAGQIDVITKAAYSDTVSSKCSVAGNHKKIKATNVGPPFNRSLPDRSWYRPLEIRCFLLKCFLCWSAGHKANRSNVYHRMMLKLT